MSNFTLAFEFLTEQAASTYYSDSMATVTNPTIVKWNPVSNFRSLTIWACFHSPRTITVLALDRLGVSPVFTGFINFKLRPF